MSSALEEVETLKTSLEKSDAELLDIAGKNESLEEEVSILQIQVFGLREARRKVEQDLGSTMKLLDEAKARLDMKEAEGREMFDSLASANETVESQSSKVRREGAASEASRKGGVIRK